MSRLKLLSRLKRLGSAVPSKIDDAQPSPVYEPNIYYDEGLTSFFRRLQFSPDGLLLITPAAIFAAQAGGKKLNKSVVYGRNSIKSQIPLLELPCPGCRPTIAVRFNPIVFKLDPGAAPLIPLPYKMVFSVACQDAVIVYNTQQRHPIAIGTGLHYATITDISWSDDGLILIISSADGFCSVMSFSLSDLGERWEGGLLLSSPQPATTDLSFKDDSRPEVKDIMLTQDVRSKNNLPGNIVRIVPTFIRPNI